MREIKFRAWDLNNKKMWTDFKCYLLLDIAGGRIFHTVEDHYLPIESNYKLMQYTGLKDKNGKEVYEGDIVKIDSGYSGDHFYPESLGIIKWEEVRWYPNNPKDKYGITWQDFNYENNVEVIGNIFENPELIPANAAQ